MGWQSGQEIDIALLDGSRRRLAPLLHPDKHTDMQDATQLMQRLNLASEVIGEAIATAAGGVRVPGGMEAPRERVAGTSGQAITVQPTQPTASLLRWLSPTLRCWLARHVLGGDAREVLQSPLTATQGIFAHQPTLHAALVPAGAALRWGLTVERALHPAWARTAWPHDALLAIAGEASGEAIQRVLEKAACTTQRARGRRVLVVTDASHSAQVMALGGRKLLNVPA